MFNWSAYSFSLLAIIVTGGRAFPTPKPQTALCKSCYDYYNETYRGRYTGPCDTLSCFDRVPAVIRGNNYEQHVYSFDVDNKPPDSGGYHYVEGYARDPSTVTNHAIYNPHRIYYLDANDCAEKGDDQNGIYPLNKEAIWLITIPNDHVASVVLTNFHLEQQQNGHCINDFVSIYAGSARPGKFCSSRDQVKEEFTGEGLERLIIKFQSNEAINAGGFSGAVWVRHRNGVSQSRHGLETVSAAEEGQSDENDETEQAIDCLIKIAKKGKTAAEQFIEDPPNKLCKEMAEAFLGYKNMGN